MLHYFVGLFRLQMIADFELGGVRRSDVVVDIVTMTTGYR